MIALAECTAETVVTHPIPEPVVTWRIEGSRNLPDGGTLTLLGTGLGRSEERAWKFFDQFCNDPAPGRARWQRHEVTITPEVAI